MYSKQKLLKYISTPTFCIFFLPIQQENSLFLENVLALNQDVWRPLTLTPALIYT